MQMQRQDDLMEELESELMEEKDIEDKLFDNDYQEEASIYPDVTIKVEREQYSLFELKRKYDKKPQQVKLDPDYQRDDVWDDKQRSELIESVLMGIPLPVFYLNETKDGQLIVVDGRQRLTTFFRFFDDQFELQQLRILNNLQGQRFSELKHNLQSKLEDYQIIAQVIKPPTPDRVIFDIFDRVNRGGTQLNQQEMRNALYQGKATKLLDDLSSSDSYLEVTGRTITPIRMKDRYMILRLISFILWRNGELTEYKHKELDEFLGRSMKYINEMDDENIAELKTLFHLTMCNNMIIFGNRAFRRTNGRYPVNFILFESFGYLFTQFDQTTCENNTVRFRELSNKLLEDGKFNELLSKDRGTGSVIPDVFDKMDELGRRLRDDK
ncbi:DUF262 domain-containing protein [Paenibacillus sp. FSL H8-0537]|uniref:DUF262 domain-containing protein n=1 Tax=Paenibacillus sp. FSL H8-0537 TaxID=2921399 RepID=UPI003100DE1D